MIVIYHNQNRIVEVSSAVKADFSVYVGQKITAGLFAIAIQFPDEVLVWCDQEEKENLNLEAISGFFHHTKAIISYCRYRGAYLDHFLGYVEATPYFNINKKVHYGTWQMSSQVGAVHASVLITVKDQVNLKDNFDYFLNSLAKLAMPFGLLCYSEPALLLDGSELKNSCKSDYYELFRFVKQHYKRRWTFLLFFNLLYFEKRLLLMPLLYSFLYRKRSFDPSGLNKILIQSNRNIIEHKTIDVLIPTIGREQYLRDVLELLAKQTFLPRNIIVIEQNPDPNSTSNLDYLWQQQWPFQIKHKFIHQTGACNARNIGLELVESEFCFLADDDLFFEHNLIENAMNAFETISNEVFMVACHLKEQTIQSMPPKQFPVFGSGAAFVKSSCLKNLSFRRGYEFGFGEDIDFGMQLRNHGFDVIYLSTFKILHLKAPMGGFRTQPVLRWQNEVFQPKPSPTMMLFHLLHQSPEQINSYKTTLFINTFERKYWIKPLHYYRIFKKKWNTSMYWAKQLVNE
ncbi:MAG: glycosyltransferase family 2 protein [Bacteroidetes bacterium]|nr:glycosyltransferase family 2 protein [Bacteroidota bacterium]